MIRWMLFDHLSSDRDFMENIYTSGEYSEKNPSFHVEDSAWKARQILKMLAKHSLRPATLCEIGCGAGEILAQLQQHLDVGTRLHGYEVSPQAFELCKQRENETLHYFATDFISHQTPQYDLLLCIDVIEHVDDYLGFARGLKPKAEYKIFHVPLDLSVQTLLRATPIAYVRQQVGHLHYFTKETALFTLQDAGYEILDWFYTPVRVELNQTRSARLMSLPRRLSFALHADLAVRILGGYSLLVLAR